MRYFIKEVPTMVTLGDSVNVKPSPFKKSMYMTTMILMAILAMSITFQTLLLPTSFLFHLRDG